MNSDELMISYLVHNQQYIQKLVEPYTTQYQSLIELEDAIFLNDIEKQYLDVVKWMIVKELTSRTGASAEDAFILLEDFDVKAYLK